MQQTENSTKSFHKYAHGSDKAFNNFSG